MGDLYKRAIQASLSYCTGLHIHKIIEVLNENSFGFLLFASFLTVSKYEKFKKSCNKSYNYLNDVTYRNTR